jgi:hypothetical protein
MTTPTAIGDPTGDSLRGEAPPSSGRDGGGAGSQTDAAVDPPIAAVEVEELLEPVELPP